MAPGIEPLLMAPKAALEVSGPKKGILFINMRMCFYLFRISKNVHEFITFSLCAKSKNMIIGWIDTHVFFLIHAGHRDSIMTFIKFKK